MFQQARDVIVVSVRVQFALSYLDDILVFSKSPQDHIVQVRRVLRILYNTAIALKLKSYKFFAESIDYISQIIRLGRLEHVKNTSEAVAKLERLTR